MASLATFLQCLVLGLVIIANSEVKGDARQGDTPSFLLICVPFILDYVQWKIKAKVIKWN